MTDQRHHPSEKRLSLLASGDLSRIARYFANRHIARCKRCRAVLDEHVALRSKLKASMSVPEVDFSALAHRIDVAAVQSQEWQRPQGPGWRWAFGVGFAVGAMAVFLLLPRPDGSGAPDPTANVALVAPHSLEAVRGSAEAQVTAEGHLAVRAFHPTSGNLTITEYYAP